MYRKQNTKQLELEDFVLPFGGKLNSKNRWIQLSKLIPWEEIEEDYEKQFSETEEGAPAKPLRVALGALLIKEKLKLTDRETVEQIRENPYLQYFIGKESFSDEEPFDASLMVYFRKRITDDMIRGINERLYVEEVKKNKKLKKKLKRKKKLR